MRITSPGHAVFAAMLTVIGLMGFVRGDFDPIWRPVPAGVPGRAALVYLVAGMSLVSGIGLVWRRWGATASGLVFAGSMLWLLLLRVPHAVVAPVLGPLWAAAKTSVLVASAWTLYIRLAADRQPPRLARLAGSNHLWMARALFGVAQIPFGVAHFNYLERTASFVPDWLPAPAFWAYFTGWAFIVAGFAVLLGVYARLAATLITWQLGLFVLLVWVPIVTNEPSVSDWIEFVVSVQLWVCTWVVAESYRGVPWLTVGKLPAQVTDAPSRS